MEYSAAMIKCRVAEILEKSDRTPYWLAKEAGIRYATIWQMVNGEIARLNLETLDRICEALECQPGDLLVRVTTRKTTKKRR
jgi:putative transcriptional regulator